MTRDEIIELMARAMCAEESRQRGEPIGCDACDGKGDPCHMVAFAKVAYDAIIAAGGVSQWNYDMGSTPKVDTFLLRTASGRIESASRVLGDGGRVATANGLHFSLDGLSWMPIPK